MAESFRIDPADMHESVQKIVSAASELKSKHDSAHREISDAHGGWVGASARALAAKLSDWKKETDDHHGALHGHANDYRSATSLFEEIDQAASQRADDVRKQL